MQQHVTVNANGEIVVDRTEFRKERLRVPARAPFERLGCPIRCISFVVLAHDEAANVLPVWRRSWNRKPSGSPASATHSGQRADRWKLFRRNAAPSVH